VPQTYGLKVQQLAELMNLFRLRAVGAAGQAEAKHNP
jgi:hypothetical protein